MTGSKTTNLVGSPILTGSDPGMKAESQEPDGEFVRFKELVRKLVRVPKSELDEKRKQS